MPVDQIQAQASLAWLTAGATLGSAIVGGLVGVSVTWLAHVFTSKRESARYIAELQAKRRERLRGKLEEILTLVLEHEDSLSKNGYRIGAMGVQAATPGADVEIRPEEPDDQLDKAEALQGLYFPSLFENMVRIRSATQGCRRLFSDELHAMGVNATTWHREMRPSYGTRLGSALAPYAEATAALVKDARKIIERDLDAG